MASKNFRVNTTHETYQVLYNAITTGRPFIYSRYGDGDLEVMLAKRPDMQQVYNEQLAAELLATFQNLAPHNLVGLCMHDPEPNMTPGMFQGWDNPMYVDWMNREYTDRVFENAIALHYYCVFEPLLMRHFLFQMKKVPNKVFVGNTSRELVEAIFGPVEHYIPTEYVDAYDGIAQWWPEVDAATQQKGLVIAATGLSTRAMNARLLAKGWDGQSLDFGSSIDFLTGNKNRTWIIRAGDALRRKVLANIV